MSAQRDEKEKVIIKEVTKGSEDELKLSTKKGSTEGSSSPNSICVEENHDQID